MTPTDQLKEVEKFLDTLRRFFKKRGYTEVITPILLTYPNLDDNIIPIRCEVSKLSQRGLIKYLHTSPEYSMKKLIAQYKKDIFQITHTFRDFEEGAFHDNEFLMLEYYKIGKDYTYLMEELEILFKELFGETLTYRGKTIKTAFKRYSLKEAFKRCLNIDLEPLTEENLKKQLSRAKIEFAPSEDEETLFWRAYIELEKHLGFEAPTIIYGYPEKYGALARCRASYCERFELYVMGIELANGYTELTDPVEVKKRLQKVAKKLNLPIDKKFIEIHKQLPKLLAGVSVGLDRLLALKLNLESIDQLYFRKDI
jgi:lysyl-tRNA synthetase class 2